MPEGLVQSPTPSKIGLSEAHRPVISVTLEAETGGSGLFSAFLILSQLRAHLGYIRLCVKTTKENVVVTVAQCTGPGAPCWKAVSIAATHSFRAQLSSDLIGLE